jgi:hypothetical protein
MYVGHGHSTSKIVGSSSLTEVCWYISKSIEKWRHWRREIYNVFFYKKGLIRYTLPPLKASFYTGSENAFIPGLPDYSWYMIPKPEKMYRLNTKCTKWS